jgi:hypothetical protein
MHLILTLDVWQAGSYGGTSISQRSVQVHVCRIRSAGTKNFESGFGVLHIQEYPTNNAGYSRYQPRMPLASSPVLLDSIYHSYLNPWQSSCPVFLKKGGNLNCTQVLGRKSFQTYETLCKVNVHPQAKVACLFQSEFSLVKSKRIKSEIQVIHPLVASIPI